MRSSVKPALYQDLLVTDAVADFFYRNAFRIMKLSRLPSFRVIRALIASQLVSYTSYFLIVLLYLILHKWFSLVDM